MSAVALDDIHHNMGHGPLHTGEDMKTVAQLVSTSQHVSAIDLRVSAGHFCRIRRSTLGRRTECCPIWRLAIGQHVCEVRRRCTTRAPPPHCTRCFRYYTMHALRHECSTAGMRPLLQLGVAAVRLRTARRPCRCRCTILCCASASPSGHRSMWRCAPGASPHICLPVCVSVRVLLCV